MTVWILLAVVQPLLVSTRHTRWHMQLGFIGVVLAVVIVLTGLHVGVASTRITPPDLKRFGLNPKEFLAVPLLSVLVFAVYVSIGVWNRKRPKIHRPMMFFASISVIGAALARITALNALYVETVFEVVFSGFFAQVILTLVFFPLKYLMTRSIDRWFVIGAGAGATFHVSICSMDSPLAWASTIDDPRIALGPVLTFRHVRPRFARAWHRGISFWNNCRNYLSAGLWIPTL